MIAIGGSWGTLSEIALAQSRGTAVVCLGGWRIIGHGGEPVPGPVHVDSPAMAVDAALAAAANAVAGREPRL